MNFTAKQLSIILIAAFALSGIFSDAAKAQGLNNNAWSPQPSNRASIAALIRQVENGSSAQTGSASAIGYVGSNVTQLICGSNSGEGKEASANAQANSSCIILNNSDGTLNIDQASDGEQAADTENLSTTNVDETINNLGNADDVLATLTGE